MANSDIGGKKAEALGGGREGGAIRDYGERRKRLVAQPIAEAK